MSKQTISEFDRNSLQNFFDEITGNGGETELFIENETLLLKRIMSDKSLSPNNTDEVAVINTETNNRIENLSLETMGETQFIDKIEEIIKLNPSNMKEYLNNTNE